MITAPRAAIAALVTCAALAAVHDALAVAKSSYRFDGNVVLVKDRFSGNHQGVAAVFKLNRKLVQLSNGRILGLGKISGKAAVRIGFAGSRHACYLIPEFVQGRKYRQGHRYTVELDLGKAGTLKAKATMKTIDGRFSVVDRDPYRDPVVKRQIHC